MEANQPAAMMVNPNQVWFPHVLQIRNASEVEPDISIPHRPGIIPVIADIVSDVEPDPETKYHLNGMVVLVDSIIKQEPAKGDWSGPFWKGVKPLKYRCLAHRYFNPAAK